MATHPTHRVDSGQMGLGVKWYSWARDHIGLGKTQLKAHMQVAKASDPWAEADRLFALGVARAERPQPLRQRDFYR